MELVLNLWPIVESESKMIQRFAARAYAMDVADSVISNTLTSLATTDYILARQFPVPKKFTLVTEHGQIEGLATVANFNDFQWTIIEEALRSLETDLPPSYGLGINAEGKHRHARATFPKEPYCVRTFLIEDTAGDLKLLTPV